MKLEKGKIQWFELFFGVSCFIQGSTVFNSFVMSTTLQDSWFMVFTGFVGVLLLLWLYMSIYKRFPGKNIIQISEMVLGPVLGKLVSACYIFFFLSLAALNTRDMGNFVVNNIMPETPIAVVMVMFMFVCAVAVRKGIKNMMSYAFIFLALAVVIIIFNSFLLIPDMSIDHFFPMFSLPLEKYLQSTHIITVIPLGEFFVFMMIVPAVNQPSKVPQAMFWGLVVGAFTMFLVVVRDIATLGNIATFMSLSTFETIRIISLWDVITRLEILYAIILITLQFFKVSVLLYCCVLGLAQLCGLRQYRSITFMFGALIINYALLVFNSTIENAVWGSRTAPIFSTFFVILLPALTFLVMWLRKIPVGNIAGEEAS